jgi:hypothetical protein
MARGDGTGAGRLADGGGVSWTHCETCGRGRLKPPFVWRRVERLFAVVHGRLALRLMRGGAPSASGLLQGLQNERPRRRVERRVWPVGETSWGSATEDAWVVAAKPRRGGSVGGRVCGVRELRMGIGGAAVARGAYAPCAAWPMSGSGARLAAED